MARFKRDRILTVGRDTQGATTKQSILAASIVGAWSAPSATRNVANRHALRIKATLGGSFAAPIAAVGAWNPGWVITDYVRVPSIIQLKSRSPRVEQCLVGSQVASSNAIANV